MTWAQRLKRTFKIDILACADCGGAVEVQLHHSLVDLESLQADIDTLLANLDQLLRKWIAP